MTLYAFTHTVDRAILGVTDEPSGAKLPPLPKLSASLPASTGTWMMGRKLEEDDWPSLSFIGFSEATAQADIEKQGYHLHRPKLNFSRENDSFKNYTRS